MARRTLIIAAMALAQEMNLLRVQAFTLSPSSPGHSTLAPRLSKCSKYAQIARSNVHVSISYHLTDKFQMNDFSSHTLQSAKESEIESDNEEESEEDRKKKVRDEIFWAKQRALAAEMSANSDAGLKKDQQDKFTKRRLALVSDTLYFSILIGAVLWLVSSNPFVTISYIFGALSGTAYSYGLGKYVETIGGTIDEAEGAGVGQARFAFLILLFVVVGKFRDQGLLEIPSILGFFTYQLASLGQGLREIDD